jgi:Radical SAM superfamily
MPSTLERGFKPNLLCIVPPSALTNYPPAGAAYLLAYLKANGCREFDFIDLRLGAPAAYSPTYNYTGIFGDAWVFDIPDLPLVLQLLDNVWKGSALEWKRTAAFDRYCVERGISPKYLRSYLTALDNYFSTTFSQISEIDFVGFTTWTTNFLSTLMAAANLKRRPKPPFIVAGGPQVTGSPSSAQLGLRSGLFDVVALSEGEETLLDLYNNFSRGQGVPQGTPGTMWLDSVSGQFCHAERSLMRISELPAPSFAEMHFEAYQKDKDRTVPFQLSRGCTDKCEFCSEWVFWRRFRPDTPDHAVQKIKELQRDYGADFIIFTDSLLNGVPKRLVEFAERLLTDKVDIRWAGFMRAQMDPETARLLARAGCNDVFVGIESFSDETLELMRKRRSKAQNIEAVEAFLGAGIGVTAGFVPGFPGDSREAFTESAMVLRGLQDQFPGQLEIQCEAFVVQPEAPIYQKLDQMGLTGKGWDEEYLDTALYFKDISSNVLCSVEGSSQGVERLGRLNMVRSIMTDELTTKDYSFESGAEETLTIHAFDFDHLVEGWHLARKKSSVGHAYGLLLTDQETKQMKELQEADPLTGVADSIVTPILERSEAAHIIPPSRFSPRVVRSRTYCRALEEGFVYAVSPFVVVRKMGWKQQHRVLIANLATERSFQKPAKVGPLLDFVNSAPRSAEELQRFWDELGCRGKLRKTIADLLGNGTLVICQARESRTEQPVIDQRMTSVSRSVSLPIVTVQALS